MWLRMRLAFCMQKAKPKQERVFKANAKPRHVGTNSKCRLGLLGEPDPLSLSYMPFSSKSRGWLVLRSVLSLWSGPLRHGRYRHGQVMGVCGSLHCNLISECSRGLTATLRRCVDCILGFFPPAVYEFDMQGLLTP